MKLVTVAEMRELEARAEAAGLPGPALMEIAGRAVADAVCQLAATLGRPSDAGLRQHHSREQRGRPSRRLAGQRVAVLVGPGNNGGDGLVAARWLASAGIGIVVLIVDRRERVDARRDLLADLGVTVATIDDTWSDGAIDAALAGSALVLDALLGIGRRRPIGGTMRRVLDRLAALGLPTIGLDIPSGLDADTGQADPATPRCVATLTLGAVKQGLVLRQGPDHAGRLIVLPIGIPRRAADSVPVDVLDGAWLAAHLPRRDLTGHKGSFGRVMVLAGSSRYIGAPILAALGAGRAGAGLVTLAAPAGVSTAAGRVPEITLLPLPGPGNHLTAEALEPLALAAARYDALVVGPGLGRDPETAELLVRALADRRLRDGPRWVIDADGLNLLAEMDGWPERLPPEAILTPHPLEMARLLGEDDVQVERLAVARAAGARWRANLVLKGAYTVVAPLGEPLAVGLAANPALATGGTGDVLAGTIAGCLAQGARPADAARLGVGLHAAAGELARAELGSGGVLASDIADRLPRAAEQLRAGIDPWGVAAASAHPRPAPSG